MTSADVGVEPIASQSGPNYVLAASDANLYQIKAAQLAQDGTDPALQQIAGTAVPVLENELTTGKSLTPSGLAGR